VLRQIRRLLTKAKLTDMSTVEEIAASVHPRGPAIAASRRIAAEMLGSVFLLMAVVGSGIMAEGLAGGNVAIALLGNTIATGAALVVLISVFGPVSGAHFNPAVTLYFLLHREIRPPMAAGYVAAQLAGAAVGVYIAHAMFAMPVFEISEKLRDGPSQWLAEFIATFGLLATIAGSIRFSPAATPMLVGLYITAAYWFTASTSFANPAVTLARMLSNSFAGIAPHSVPGFVVAQLLAAVAAGYAFFPWLFSETRSD
jgi:glycerol uptake facilitator-like aquaporin